MPTYGDETLHERYAREHADHLARLAKMTPEQIAEMELSLHNAMAELDRLRAQASQGGEAVEVVATVEAYGGKWAGIHWGECIGSTEDPERQLMTAPSTSASSPRACQRAARWCRWSCWSGWSMSREPSRRTCNAMLICAPCWR